ncbi:MAG: hypothetical protein QXP54_06285 [Thermofilum sp.]
MRSTSTVRPLVLALSSIVLALVGDLMFVVLLSIVLAYLALSSLGRATAGLVKALAVFNLVYFATSLIVQVAVLGYAEIHRTALQSLRLFSLALSSIPLSSSIYPILVRRACSSWSLLSLLIAMRSIGESYIALSETLDAIRVNYGLRRRLSFGVLRVVVENTPSLVLDAVLRRFESAITMIPRAWCGAEDFDN